VIDSGRLLVPQELFATHPRAAVLLRLRNELAGPPSFTGLDFEDLDELVSCALGEMHQRCAKGREIRDAGVRR
jgi:hypothetical protein